MKILFIDDEEDRAIPIVEYLQIKDHEVVFKSVILDAYIFFHKHKKDIDIIITDVMMPVFDNDMILFDNNIVTSDSAGLLLVDLFQREMPENRIIPIIICTARKDVYLKYPQLESNVSIAYIQKPMEMSYFVQTIEKLHNRYKNHEKSQESFKEFMQNLENKNIDIITELEEYLESMVLFAINNQVVKEDFYAEYSLMLASYKLKSKNKKTVRSAILCFELNGRLEHRELLKPIFTNSDYDKVTQDEALKAYENIRERILKK